MADSSKRGVIELDGVAQANIEQCDIDVNSNDQEVITLLGLVGYSDGASIIKVTGKSCIPVTGREVDYFDLCDRHVTCTYTFRMAGKSRIVRGRFMNVKESTDAKNPNAIDFTFGGFNAAPTAS